MTARQAQAKARRLWGEKASASDRKALGLPYDCWPGYCSRYNINSGTWACNDGKGKVNIHGNGDTWEAAFHDAMFCYKYWELPQCSSET